MDANARTTPTHREMNTDIPTPRTEGILKLLAVAENEKSVYEYRKAAKEGVEIAVEELERELTLAQSQLTEKTNLLADKDKEIAMLRADKERDKDVMNLLSAVAGENEPSYIHIDKVKPLLETLKTTEALLAHGKIVPGAGGQQIGEEVYQVRFKGKLLGEVNDTLAQFKQITEEQ